MIVYGIEYQTFSDKLKINAMDMEETEKTYRRKSGYPSMIRKSEIDTLNTSACYPTMYSLAINKKLFAEKLLESRLKRIGAIERNLNNEKAEFEKMKAILDAEIAEKEVM